jgi:hypothetical protein
MSIRTIADSMMPLRQWAIAVGGLACGMAAALLVR